MSIESQEFVRWREDEYARAAFEAGRLAPVVKQGPEWDDDEGREAVCRCCGELKLIRAHMHVCMECFREAAR